MKRDSLAQNNPQGVQSSGFFITQSCRNLSNSCNKKGNQGSVNCCLGMGERVVYYKFLVGDHITEHSEG